MYDISLVLGKTLLTLSVSCPDDGVLSELWYGLVINYIRLGNKMYDSSPRGARNLSPNEAASTLRDVSPVKLDPALPVRLTDSNSSSRLSSQINELLNRRDAVALLVYNQRTRLLYSTKDGKIVLIDSHQHGEKMGPVIVKGTCSHLAEFLNSIQEVLNMNETSYAELICFS